MNLIKKEYPSKSSSLIYTAILDTETGASSCGCRGWVYQRAGQPRSCVHTKALRVEYGFSPVADAVVPVKDVKYAKPAPAKAPAAKPLIVGAAPKPVAPVAKPKPVVTPEQFAKAQAEVERAVARVKGKRRIEVDEDDEAEAPAKVVAPAKVALPPSVAAAVAAAFAPPAPKAQSLGSAPAIKPMLASAMREDQSFSDFVSPEWVLEEKFDGHRLTLVVEAVGAPVAYNEGPEVHVTGWSRPGQDRPSASRPLPAAMVADAKKLPVGIYDGELYVPGGTSSDVARLDKAEALRLVLFDIVELAVLGPEAKLHDRPFSERRKLLELALSPLPKGSRIHIAEQQPVSLAAVQAIWAAKGEGAILKKLDATYRSGWRTPSWVKVKKVSAAELTITGFEAGKNGPYSVAKLRHDDGRETTVKVLTQDLLRAIEKEPKAWVGRRLVVSYMGKTTSGAMRHAVWDHVLEATA